MTAAELAAEIYDYFTPIETACFNVLKAREISCNTAVAQFISGKPNETDPLQFQKPRPRTEIKFAVGEAGGILLPKMGVEAAAGSSYALNRTGELTLATITLPNVIQHRAYVAQLLFIADTLALTMNNSGLLKHIVIDSLMISDCAPDYEPQEGDYKSNITCAIEFSIKKASLEQLIAMI